MKKRNQSKHLSRKIQSVDFAIQQAAVHLEHQYEPQWLGQLVFPSTENSDSPTLGTLPHSNSFSRLSTFMPLWLLFPSVASYYDSFFLSPFTGPSIVQGTPMEQLRNCCLCQGADSQANTYVMGAQSGDKKPDLLQKGPCYCVSGHFPQKGYWAFWVLSFS